MDTPSNPSASQAVRQWIFHIGGRTDTDSVQVEIMGQPMASRDSKASL